MSDSITIAAFAGSLRKGSYNRMLLRNAVKLSPPGVRVDEIDISEIPLLNVDVETPPPPAVAHMRDAIRAADGLLIISPEYNFSISGVTKNAIDWASRPPDDSCLDGKPVGLAGCSPGYFGTVRSKFSMLPIVMYNNMHLLNDPMLHVSKAPEKFNESGELVDEGTKQELRELLEALAAWSRRFKSTTP